MDKSENGHKMVLRCKYGHGLEKLIPHRVQILGSITLLLPPPLPPTQPPFAPDGIRASSVTPKMGRHCTINALVMGEEEKLTGEAKQLPPPALAQGLDPLLRFIDLV